MKITKSSFLSLEKLENNYRLIYVIIMSVPLIVALENICFVADQATGIWRLKDFGQFHLGDIVLFVVFLLVYARFFLGDLRYLDLKYLHRQNSPTYFKRLNIFSRFIDFYSLVLHAIFFYILAGAITNFQQFYITLILILSINTLWLACTYLATNKFDRGRLEVRSSLKWSVNNFIFVILFLILYKISNHSFSSLLLMIFFVLAIINTIVDYSLAWKLYFPEIHEV